MLHCHMRRTVAAAPGGRNGWPMHRPWQWAGGRSGRGVLARASAP